VDAGRRRRGLAYAPRPGAAVVPAGADDGGDLRSPTGMERFPLPASAHPELRDAGAAVVAVVLPGPVLGERTGRAGGRGAVRTAGAHRLHHRAPPAGQWSDGGIRQMRAVSPHAAPPPVRLGAPSPARLGAAPCHGQVGAAAPPARVGAPPPARVGAPPPARVGAPPPVRLGTAPCHPYL